MYSSLALPSCTASALSGTLQHTYQRTPILWSVTSVPVQPCIVASASLDFDSESRQTLPSSATASRGTAIDTERSSRLAPSLTLSARHAHSIPSTPCDLTYSLTSSRALSPSALPSTSLVSSSHPSLLLSSLPQSNFPHSSVTSSSIPSPPTSLPSSA